MAFDTRIRQQVREWKKQFQPRAQVAKGFTGDASGNIFVTGRSGYIYVTDWNGIVHQAYNDVAPTDQPGYAVRFGFDVDDPTRLRILSLLNPYAQLTYAKVPPHHTTHEFPGTDTVFVQSPQIVPALVLAKASSMTVAIFPFWLRMTDGTRKFITYSEQVLSGYRPDSGANWVLIGYSQATGSISITVGPNWSQGVTQLLTTNIPAPASQVHLIAAVACYAGQTSITQNSSRNEIVDLRWTNAKQPKWGEIVGSITDQADLSAVTSRVHTHARWMWIADGTATSFDLPDYADNLTGVFDSGTLQDMTSVDLSADRSQVVFTAAPTAGHVLTADYIIARM